jgi:2-amino-4-hydroxy-6-hydroxymethyldihydropteridine diphosphokinase
VNRTTYAIALGSNRRHGRHGAPAGVLRAALHALAERGVTVERVSPIHHTSAVGPAGRAFANAVALVSTPLDPPRLLAELKGIERRFGRRPGRRWGPRVLDLDIILWSEGCWEGGGKTGLVVPHPAMRERGFVLQPLAEIAPAWRDPISGATIRQLLARHARRQPLHRAG